MEKQTAVEWLFAHLLPHLDWSKIENKIKFRQLEQEALNMEAVQQLPQQEISDEEIEKGGWKYFYENKISLKNIVYWINACKWYREQLKLKSCR